MTTTTETENNLPETDRYLVDIIGFAADDSDVVSDIRLAARLNHDKDQATDILYTIIDGEECVLRIVGDIFIEDGNGTMDSYDVNNDDDFLQKLESSKHYDEFIDAKLPYFEWISADGGDVLCDVFDEISIDPAKEIEKFKALLNTSDAPSGRLD